MSGERTMKGAQMRYGIIGEFEGFKDDYKFHICAVDSETIEYLDDVLEDPNITGVEVVFICATNNEGMAKAICFAMNTTAQSLTEPEAENKLYKTSVN